MEWDNIKKSLENNNYAGRTIRGIADELGLEESFVEKILNDKAGEVVRLSNKAVTGEDLYTTQEFYQANIGYIGRIMNAISGSNTAVTFSK